MLKRSAMAVLALALPLAACGGGTVTDTADYTTTTLAVVHNGWMESSPDHDECLRLDRMYDALVDQALGQLGSHEFEQTKDDIQSVVDELDRLRC